MPELVASTKLFAGGGGAPPQWWRPLLPHALGLHYFNEAILMWRLEHLNHSSI